MEYGLEWYTPSRVLILKVSGDVSLEDLARFNQSMIDYLEEGTAPVHLISTAGDIGHVPTNLMLIKETVTYLRHPHMGWTIVVQEKTNSIAAFILSVATQATGMKMRLVKSVADGLDTLRRIDPSIDVQVPTTDEDFNRQ